MTAIWIVCGVFAFLLLILIIPLHMQVSFDGQLSLRLRYLFFTYSLYPRPEKKKKKFKQKKVKKKKEIELSRTEEMLQSEGVAAVISYYIKLAQIIKTAALGLFRTITVDKLKLNIKVASDDAAETAINYGQLCAAVYPVHALIESSVRVRSRSINIAPDFLNNEDQVSGEIRLHVLPLRVLLVLLLFFIGYISNTSGTKATE